MDEEETNVNLKRWQLGARMMEHPVATAASGFISGALSAAVGTIHSPGMAVAMAIMGIVVGAPVGAGLAESAGSRRHVTP